MKVNIIIIIGLLLPFSTAQGQSINPHQLFLTADALSELIQIQENESPSTVKVKLSSKAAEAWVNSWAPGSVQPINPSLTDAKPTDKFIRSKLDLMEDCSANYFNLRRTVYTLGYNISFARAQSNTDCTSCLQETLLELAMDARVIGRVLGDPFWIELAQQISAEAEALKAGMNKKLALKQNQGVLPVLAQITVSIKEKLPNKEFACSRSNKSNSKTSFSSKKDKERKGNTTVWINSSANNMVGNTYSSSWANGYTIGIQRLRGEKIYFLLGFDYFKYRSGTNLMTPTAGNNATGNNILGFTGHIGGGGAYRVNEDIRIGVNLFLRLFVYNAINGNLNSAGDALVNYSGSSTFHIGTDVSYKKILFKLGYEKGLKHILEYRNDQLKYLVFHLGIGVIL